jgi:hypothetical protein
VSAITTPIANADGARRPSLSGLTWSVLGGEVLAAVLLWIAGIVLDILAIAPLGGGNEWVWLPWRIDGAWALVGAIGWGYVVCSLVAVFVGQSIERRGYERPTTAWLIIAIAISGYGAMAVGRTAAAHVVVAVLAGAVVIRLVAFRRDGSARSWRWSISPRLRLEVMLLALVAGLSYSAFHPFAADGSGGSYSSATVYAHHQQFETADVGLSESRMPVDITSATLTGPGANHVRLSPPVLGRGGVIDSTTSRPSRFPYRLGASQQLWISTQVELTSCGFVKLNALELHYTVLGIATQQTIPLQSPLTMRCSR